MYMTKRQEELIDKARKSLKAMINFIPSPNGDVQKILAIDGTYEAGMDALDALEDDLNKII